MNRSAWKSPYIPKKEYIEFLENNNTDTINIYPRHYIISHSIIGSWAAVYNGKDFLSFLVTSKMVGHKFGEFGVTKIIGKAVPRSKKSQKKKKKK